MSKVEIWTASDCDISHPLVTRLYRDGEVLMEFEIKWAEHIDYWHRGYCARMADVRAALGEIERKLQRQSIA